MTGGVDPEKAARVREVTKNITGVITINRKESMITLQLNTSDPNAAKAMDEFLSSFAQMLATQMQTFFGITGKIINKKG